jgi:hypothetical protein
MVGEASGFWGVASCSEQLTEFQKLLVELNYYL